MLRLLRPAVALIILLLVVGGGVLAYRSWNARRGADVEKTRGGEPLPPTWGPGGGPYALLVGCTQYDNLPLQFQLTGPANDVVLMKKVLRERFGFPEENIITLSEAAGSAFRPTRAHIEAAFHRLAELVKPGDKVFILMAGHGSQQPDQFPPDPEDPEPDGLDETFLPADVGAWDGARQVVANAIIDDELRLWAKAITDRGAVVFAVVDACHSGTVFRGASDEVEREVPAAQLVPAELLEQARKRAAAFYGQSRDVGPGEALPFHLGSSGALVALYAAQAHEPTVERPLPKDGASPQQHGLLTYMLCQVLTQAQSPLTYNELIQRIHNEYVRFPRSSPNPLLEGTNLDQEVLGTKTWPGRSRFILERDGKDWKVTAGSLHGLTEGSILAVYPPAGTKDAAKLIGHVKVRQCRTLDAIVQPWEFARMPEPRELPDKGSCEVVFLDFGSLRRRVVVGQVTDAERLRNELRKLAGEPGAPFELTEDERRADWVIRELDGKLILVPAEGVVAGTTTPKFVLARDRPEQSLRDVLGRIVRAQNLLAMAGSNGGDLVGGRAAGQLDIEVTPVKLRDRNDQQGTPIPWDTLGFALVAGDRIAFRIHNRGKVAVDVTLLYVESQFGIHAVYPRQAGESNRLRPGETALTAPGKISGTLGREHLAVIAVRALDQGNPREFTWLSQPRLEVTRDSEQLSSSLARLLMGAVFMSPEGTRGWSAADDGPAEEFALRLLSFQVSPAKTP